MAKTSEANFQLRIQKLLMLVMWIGRGDGWKEGIEQLALVKFRTVMACWLISKKSILILGLCFWKDFNVSLLDGFDIGVWLGVDVS